MTVMAGFSFSASRTAGKYISFIVRDGKMLQAGVLLPGGHIIETRLTAGKIACTDGLPQEAEADAAGRVEQLLHHIPALRGCEFVFEQPSGTVRKRRAEAVHSLETHRVIDGDDGHAIIRRGTAGKPRVGLPGESLLQIGGRLHHLHGLRAGKQTTGDAKRTPDKRT